MKKLGGVSIFSPKKLYDSTGVSIAASGSQSYTVTPEDIVGKELFEEVTIFVELTYHAAATSGGRVDIVPYQPDKATLCSDAYVTAVTPSFAAAGTKSKLGSPVDMGGIQKFDVVVVNEDTAHAMTLKKLYLY